MLKKTVKHISFVIIGDFIPILKAIFYSYLGNYGSEKNHTPAYFVQCMTEYVTYISAFYVTNCSGTIYRDRNIYQDVLHLSQTGL